MLNIKHFNRNKRCNNGFYNVLFCRLFSEYNDCEVCKSFIVRAFIKAAAKKNHYMQTKDVFAINMMPAYS